MANGLEERRKNIDKVNEQPLIKKRDNSLAGGARKFGRAALRSLALPFGGAIERGAGPAGKQLLAAGKGALAAGTLLPIPKSKKKATKAVGEGGVRKAVVEEGLEAAKVATGKTGKTGVPFGTSGTRRFGNKLIGADAPAPITPSEITAAEKIKGKGSKGRAFGQSVRFDKGGVTTLIGRGKKAKPKGGVRKRKSLDPFTVKGIGNIGSAFGDIAGKFFSPEAQKRRATARAQAGKAAGRVAGVKSRRAQSEVESKRITALSKAIESIGVTGDQDTKGLLEGQLRNLISPTDPQEALDLKSTLRR